MLRHLRTFENLVELSLKTDDPAGAGRGAWPRPEEETAARWLDQARHLERSFPSINNLDPFSDQTAVLKILEDYCTLF